MESIVMMQRVSDSLSSRYFKRLKLNRSDLESMSPLERLEAVSEAHLKYIPFENLSQHGVGEPVSLDADKLANKLLEQRRGGFCFELNGLMAELLLEMGYNLVRVIATVYAGDDFMTEASHMVVMVTLPSPDDPDEEVQYMVDAGFGEPAIHPLRYEFNTKQATPDGMVSRLVKKGDDVILEWFDVESDTFVPRYKFKHEDAVVDMPGPALGDFYNNLQTVYHPESHFAQKTIVCSVDRDEKKAVSGNRMKITSPRFEKGAAPVVRELGNVSNVRAVLESEFGIPLEETKGLDLERSLQSPPEMWLG